MSVMTPRDQFGRAVLRAVLIVVVVALTLYVIVLLRQPLTWIAVAAFVAVAMSGPVNVLSRRMRRGPAIALSYLGLILVPIAVGALLVPTLVNHNKTLSDLNDKYDFTSEIESLASELPSRLGDAAGVLRDIGVGIVN